MVMGGLLASIHWIAFGGVAAGVASDRFEPRMAKRRPKRYDRLTRPRREIKLQILKRLRKI